MRPDAGKEISSILKKLHELFLRYERQKKKTDMHVARRDKLYNVRHDEVKRRYSEENLRCKR